jgi:hypothetical protein
MDTAGSNQKGAELSGKRSADASIIAGRRVSWIWGWLPSID